LAPQPYYGSMLYQTIPADRSATELADELLRCHRIVHSLNNPNDLRILEGYIAELEMRHGVAVKKAMFAR
jgi:hypothetical protein